MSVLTESWHAWYIAVVDSESRLRFLKFRPKNPFLGKFGPKNSKLYVLSENWYSWYLKNTDSKSRFRLLKFWPQNLFLGKFGLKNSKLSILSKNWYIWYLNYANSYSSTSFMNFQIFLIPFWENLDQKSQNCSFCLKVGIYGISRMLTLVSTFVFLISN